MAMVARVLDTEPVKTLDAYRSMGGGAGLDAARRLGSAAVLEEITASGLRGRGGAGFPTGVKWSTVAAHGSDVVPTTVVVNASEGEPGSFKDRTLLRHNPFRVLEGALIAAYVMGADNAVVAVKASFAKERERLRAAINEITEAGWAEGVTLWVLDGPAEYLYGEETALLEVLNGRPPFPRIAPPYRRGADEVSTGTDAAADASTGSAADASMASPDDATPAPPALVNNVETIANIPGILASGAAWFRTVGTDDSPGTVICTVSGSTHHAGVGEFAMGTPLTEVIETLGGGPAGSQVRAVLSGVANPFLPGALLDTPVSHEGMEAAGTGLGAAGFIVFDETVDLVAAAAGVSRFLAVESCGQCTPCKQNGLEIADLLDGLRQRTGDRPDALELLADRVATVADEARCFLASQHQRVVGSLLSLFPDEVAQAAQGQEDSAAEAILVAPIADLVDGRVVLDTGQADKQPDWTHDDEDSGQAPADRLAHSAS
jgi:NADH:ubiquinone oxidoreductase subunit F (NADH-binding)